MAFSEPEMVQEDASHRVAFWNNVCLADFWGELDAAQTRAFGEHYRKLLLRYPQGIVVLGAVWPSTGMPSPESRSESVRVLKDLGDKLLQVAIVIDADGVLGSMTRSVLRGINTVVRPGRIVILDDMERAVELCAPHVVRGDLPRDELPGRLMAAVTNVRSRYTISTLSWRSSRR